MSIRKNKSQKAAPKLNFIRIFTDIITYLDNFTNYSIIITGRNNHLRMGFYCVLTLSPDVPYLFLPKIGQKRQNWQFLGIFGDIHIQIWGHCEIW